MANKWQIPLRPDGSIIFDTYYVNRNTKGIQFKDNYEFRAALIINGYYRGRSAAGIYLNNFHTSEKYEITISNFLDVIRKLDVHNGVIEEAKWTFEKKGTHISLRLAEE